MVVRMESTLKNIQSYMMASARFRDVTIGEPFGAPQTLHAALMLDNYAIPEVTLTNIIELRTIMIRLYAKAIEESREKTELLMDAAVSEVYEDFLGDVTMSNTIREVWPTGISTRFGFSTVDSTIFRIADITIPLIIDDSAELAR